MGDSTLRGREPLGLKSISKHWVIPALLGACLTIFFFHFVPEMMDVLWEQTSFQEAFNKSWDAIYTGYHDLLTGRSEKKSLIGWPLVGGLVMVYIFRIAKL